MLAVRASQLESEDPKLFGPQSYRDPNKDPKWDPKCADPKFDPKWGPN